MTLPILNRTTLAQEHARTWSFELDFSAQVSPIGVVARSSLPNEPRRASDNEDGCREATKEEEDDDEGERLAQQ